MGISFNEIPGPASLRRPGTFIEIDNSKAQQGPSIQTYNVLVVGQKIAAGTKAELVKDLITSADQAKNFYGRGSMLAGMIEKYFQGNKVTALDAVAIDDAGGAAVAEGTLTLGSGPASEAGTMNVYIGGRRYQVAVASGDTTTVVAAAIVTAVTDDVDAYVTAGNVADVITFTCKNLGEEGNAMDIRLNYNVGDKTPAGVGETIVAMSSGSANPLFSEILPIIGEKQYHVILFPWTDATNLSAIETELADRFGPIRQNDGVASAAARDTVSNLDTLGNARNSKHVTLHGYFGPNPPAEYAAAVGAQMALSGQADPARPLQTLVLAGILAPNETEKFTDAERNTLLFDGISTNFTDAGGLVRIERLISTFQTNAFGGADTSYLDMNTLLTLSYLRFDYRANLLAKFPRHKLADDGTRFGPGQVVVTPQLLRAESITKFRQWEELGLVENADQFKNDLVIQRNSQDPNRLDIILPPDLINQARIFAVQLQFLL